MNHVQNRNLLLMFNLMLWIGASQVASAKTIQVQFDVSDVVQVHDIETPDWARKEKVRLVEARIEISSLIHQGDDQQLVHFIYRIESPRRSLKVVDYLPRTQLSSPVIGPLAINKTQEKGSRVGGSASTRTGTTVDVMAKVDASVQNSNRSSVQYKLLPPQKLIAASGTINRQHGVYFKLKPSTLTSLEGGKEFVCIFLVPEDWKADYLTIHCEARAYRKDTFDVQKQEKIITQQKFKVGLYTAGEQHGRKTALNVVQAINQLELAKKQLHRYEESYSTKTKKVANSIQYEFYKLNPKHLYQRVTGNYKVRKPVAAKLSRPEKCLHQAQQNAELTMRKLIKLNQTKASTPTKPVEESKK